MEREKRKCVPLHSETELLDPILKEYGLEMLDDSAMI